MLNDVNRFNINLLTVYTLGAEIIYIFARLPFFSFILLLAFSSLCFCRIQVTFLVLFMKGIV